MRGTRDEGFAPTIPSKNTVPRGSVLISAENGQSLMVMLNDNSPTVSGGFGGWEVIDRPKRVGLTRFKGRNPFKQDIPVLFDGFISHESQEEPIRVLHTMATQPGQLTPPPKVRVSGLAHMTNLWWVIDDLDEDNQDVIWDMVNGRPARLRQAYTIHLLEFVDDTVITTPAQPVVYVTPVKKITTPAGMTLKQIAQLMYGDPDRWKIIYDANPLVIASPDPRQLIPKGTALLTPGGKTPTFIVP